MSGRLTGKVALVTGAASGIGAAIAEGFAHEGATVYRGDLGWDEAPVASGAKLRLDVTQWPAWEDAVRTIVEAHSQIDILVNNAGVASYEGLHDFHEQEWNRTVGVNMLGPALGLRAVLPHMIRARGGSIINISSVYGAKAVEGEAAYHASKAGLLGMTRNAAASYSQLGIRVNALLPGLVTTPMTTGQDPDSNAALVAATPMRRPAAPSEIVGPAVFLASDEASYVTGVALPVDGGLLAV